MTNKLIIILRPIQFQPQNIGDDLIAYEDQLRHESEQSLILSPGDRKIMTKAPVDLTYMIS